MVEEAKALLSARYTERLTLDELGRAVNVSPFHLARSFRRHTGYTLHEYRTHLRLRAALERLAAGDEDLATIARAVGYSSHSHLTASFRRVFGVPPSRVRRRLPSGVRAADSARGGRGRRHGLHRRGPQALPREGQAVPGRVRAHARRGAVRRRPPLDRARDRAQHHRGDRRPGDGQPARAGDDRRPGLADRARPVQHRDQHPAAHARGRRASASSRPRCAPASTTPRRARRRRTRGC